ncbi:MAG: AAA family ATPase [Gammaproteobacteria bacterium]|nr:AAA family ATPase [Gammaproteobacteria bacterium]
MSLWWVKKDELDEAQIALIEDLSLEGSYLVVGPPGCGKTNVLLRRAQFVRAQGFPNVEVLTFTRPLTEFVKTGCVDEQGREIFPRNRVSTIESWARSLYRAHHKSLPDDEPNLAEWKRTMAKGVKSLSKGSPVPRYDALFVDEAQDLLQEEVEAVLAWTDTAFFVGDDRQKIYGESAGLTPIRNALPGANQKQLKFHYRLAPEICRAADRVLIPEGQQSLAATCHYRGPSPSRVNVEPNPMAKADQVSLAIERLKRQVRVFADFLDRGDRIAVITARTADRDCVFERLLQDPTLGDQVQLLRARTAEERDYDPTVAADRPICVLTAKGSKGLEFRTLHWLFADELSHHHTREEYYTVLTRAKTSMDIYYTTSLPGVLAGAAIPQDTPTW